MNELVSSLKIAFADTFAMYFKAHVFHWNVEGLLFSQYHEFFGSIYKEVYGSVDHMAEEIRALGAYAPSSLPELYADMTVEEQPADVSDATPTTKIVEMLVTLDIINKKVLLSLGQCFTLATERNEQGLADFIAGRIDAHKKHAWMLASSIK
jgi:starvation-inducible DNA-binding protein